MNDKWIGYLLTIGILTAPPITSAAAPNCSLTQLTFGREPSISEDGSRLAFYSGATLLSFDIDSRTRSRIVSTDTRLYGTIPPVPFLSGDGTRIAFTTSRNLTGNNADGNLEIFLFDERAADITQITDTIANYNHAYNYVRSIDSTGEHIVFESDAAIAGYEAERRIILFDATSNAFIPVTETINESSMSPSISADGSRIAFASNLYPTGFSRFGNSEIFLFDTHTHEYAQVTNTTSGFNILPAIGGDGKRIVFRSDADLAIHNADRSWEIFLFDTTSKTFTQITDSAGDNAYYLGYSYGTLLINADGSRIVFQSYDDLTGENADRSSEIYLYDVDIKAFAQITDIPSGDPHFEPSISADGSRVVFVSGANLTGRNPDGKPAIFLADCEPAIVLEPQPEPEPRPEPEPNPDPEPAVGRNTETLRAFPVKSGSGFVTAGTGLVTQGGRLDVKVPAGATVSQVILYWAGRGTGDDSIFVDGHPVTGDLIGGPSPGLNNPAMAYRADITRLALIGAGANRLIVEGLDFGTGGNAHNSGAGVVVIYKEARRANAAIRVRDGVDFAFSKNTPPLNGTRAQTFTFKGVNRPRAANLSLFVADAMPLAADVILITVGNKTHRMVDRLKNHDGAHWDTLALEIRIPAGASSVKVQILSARGVNSRLRFTDSLAWVAATLSVPSR